MPWLPPLLCQRYPATAYCPCDTHTHTHTHIHTHGVSSTTHVYTQAQCLQLYQCRMWLARSHPSVYVCVCVCVSHVTYPLGWRISAAYLPQGRWRTPRNLIAPRTVRGDRPAGIGPSPIAINLRDQQHDHTLTSTPTTAIPNRPQVQTPAYSRPLHAFAHHGVCVCVCV